MDADKIIPLAEAFRDCLVSELPADKIAEIKRRNATPQYSGPVCASHDFIDANEVMAEAFEKVVGHFPLMPSDFDDDDAEGQSKVEEQAALWSAAWDHAKATFLTERAAA